MRRALITGAARRIGRSMALHLARQGYEVAVHYNASRGEADAVVAEIERLGSRGIAIAGDLAEASSAARIVEETLSKLGPLSVLINNASRFEPDEAHTMTVPSWNHHLDTNLRAPVFLAQTFAAQLREDVEGNIVNIIDQRVWKLNPRFFSYTVSKAALWTVTRTMAQAFAPRIRVNAIGPGPALPNIRMDDEDFQKQASLTLLGRGTTPAEICDALDFILSARAMTGQMIALDGGQHLVWQTPDVVDVNE
jgi:NAD(P)-dependent dehydrogenase (short-subunit alcohol dehydrogenase family)